MRNRSLVPVVFVLLCLTAGDGRAVRNSEPCTNACPSYSSHQGEAAQGFPRSLT